VGRSGNGAMPQGRNSNTRKFGMGMSGACERVGTSFFCFRHFHFYPFPWVEMIA
jgi:hypothetical protein